MKRLTLLVALAFVLLIVPACTSAPATAYPTFTPFPTATPYPTFTAVPTVPATVPSTATAVLPTMTNTLVVPTASVTIAAPTPTLSLPSPTPTVITANVETLFDGLRIIVGSYELQNGGNTISVSIVVDNTTSQSKVMRLDWMLVADDQSYAPKNAHSIMDSTFATLGGQRTVLPKSPDLLFVTFDTPPGRLPTQDASEFMRKKVVKLWWQSYNAMFPLELR